MNLKCILIAAACAAVLSVTASGADRTETVRKEIAKQILPANCGATTFTSLFNELEAADAAADEAWRALGSKAEYEACRAKMHDRYVAAIGGFPEKTPLNAKVTAKVVRPGYRIEKVLFESRPGVFVTGLLYLPDAAKFQPPYAAYLIVCGHSGNGKGSKDYQRGCVMGAEAGMAAFIIDPIGQGERCQVPSLGNTSGHNLFGVNAMLVGQSMAGYRLWDAMRALDYFESRADIRHGGYGVMGNSGGGTMSALLCAMDPRITAAAPACYISSLREVCQHDGPQDAEQNIFGQLAFGLNHAGYVLMGGNAVRLHCCHNDFFPFYGSRETYRTVAATAAKCGLDVTRYDMTDVPGPHGWKESTRSSSVQWMRRWLKGEKDALPIDVEACRLKDVGFDVEKVEYGLADPKENKDENYNVTPNGKVTELPGFRTVYDCLRDELDRALAARKPRTAAETAAVVRRRAGIRSLAELVGASTRDGSATKATEKRTYANEVDGISIARAAFHFPGGLNLPTVTLTPKSAGHEPILLVGDGKRADLADLALSYADRGHPVMLADLIGAGEIGDVRHRFYGAKNADEEPAVILYLLGKSLVGVRAEEMLVLADSLRVRFGRVPRIVARGRMAIPAAHAFAAEPGAIAGVETIEPPPSWETYVRTAQAPCPYANAVHGALLEYDWTDLLENASAKWLADPFAWRIRGGEMSSRGPGEALADAPYGKRVRISAEVTPVSAPETNWATAGVSAYFDRRTFWHVALVKGPEAAGSRHDFELAEMLDGEWPVQHRLKCVRSERHGNWEFGKSYLLDLELAPKGVRGSVRERGSGKLLYAAEYAFNGPAADRGRPCLRTTGRFVAQMRDVSFEVADEVPGPESQTVERVPYASNSFLPDVKAKATGFFRVERDGDRWNVIDPLGRGFVPMGVDHVNYRGMFCEKLGYAPYFKHNETNYASKAEWEEETLGRLKSWGFNMLGAGDNRSLAHRGLVHTVFLSIGDRLCYGDEEWWICENLHAPCTAFPNVFHPDFKASCEWTARTRCAPNRDDPWLFGYFLDNEFSWWGGRGGSGLATGLFDTVMKKPDSHSAKQALVAFVGGREVTPELKLEFAKLCAERYFSIATAAVRKYDPNHMVLGCRFAGTRGAHEEVWRIAAKYSDIVTFNFYPWADLDRNVVFNRRGGMPVAEHFTKFYEIVRKPMIVTEWSFPALDTGRPCLHGAGQRFLTQDLRVRATELFAKTMLSLPFLAGYDYFMWVDQPALGMNHLFPEDSNYGLVQENGVPHRGITEMFARLQKDVGKWRCAPLPEARDVKDEVVASEREKFLKAAKGDSAAVKFERVGNGWTLSNDVGVCLKGVVGPGKDAVSSVTVGGTTFGTLGILAELTGDGGLGWIDAREAKDVRFVREGTCGSVEIVSAGAFRNCRFELTLRVTVAPGRKDFIGEIVSMRNVCDVPIEIVQLYLRPFAADKPLDKAGERVPNLWKGPSESYWAFPDGRRYGALSHDATAAGFRLWVNEKGGQHPDVPFVPGKKLTLAPGETLLLESPMSAVIIAE